MKYIQFIHRIQQLGTRNLTYKETHHILPRCMGGTDDDDNLIDLTLREHFIAHAFLARENDHLGIQSAFIQMCHKRDSNWTKVNSKIYSALKKKLYNSISKHNLNKVYVNDIHGNNICLTKDEYKKSSYSFHTKGKVYVFNKTSNLWSYITTEEYYKNKNIYLTRLFFAKFKFFDNALGVVVTISKSEAKERNTSAGFNRYVQIQETRMKLINGDTILLKEYDPTIHEHHLTNTLVVREKESGKSKQITTKEYYNNKEKYITSTKGRVLAKDLSGNKVLLTKEEYNTGLYVGQTKGLTTVYDSLLEKYVQIPTNDAKNPRYHGPNKNKVNVYDIIEKQPMQIPKSVYIKEKNIRYFAGGIWSVKIINVLTNNEEKCIIDVIDNKLNNGYKLKKPLTKLQKIICDLINK